MKDLKTLQAHLEGVVPRSYSYPTEVIASGKDCEDGLRLYLVAGERSGRTIEDSLRNFHARTKDCIQKYEP